ncbi:hypothetical protein [Pontixanthobacter sp.]|uniref:hypothetical protein n=1 Tax=Pontixanthobacter sp. TaxID=2792078 RepID=UPI003C7C559B
MKKTIFTSSFSIAALVTSSVALAEDERARPEVFTKVLECRAIVDDALRVTCYDLAVTALASAEENDNLLVASREDVRNERRGLFGLQLPRIGLFSGRSGDDQEELQVKEITAIIKAAAEGRRGYIFTLEDGSVWYQTDTTYINRPKRGDPITIKRAALGSFMARVNDGLGIRVKRQQ